MMILSEAEVNQVAWKLVVRGAESMAEDWIDEDGNFTEHDAERIADRQMELIRLLKASGGLLGWSNE